MDATPSFLVVDDNRDNADGLALMLEGWGCRTDTAYGGGEAIETADHMKPDAVVLDLCMPDPNGIETCRRIRENSWAAETVIVGVTGSWIAQEVALNQADFDGVLLKTCETEPLKELVALLHRQKSISR
jgi:CheY-like chemotaxis protein